jgi:hypothetical protein
MPRETLADLAMVQHNCCNQAITLKCSAQRHDEVAVGTTIADRPPARIRTSAH